MVKCLWCKRFVANRLSVQKLLSFKSLEPFPRCKNCSEQLVRLSEQKHLCPVCSRVQANDEICRDCVRWQKVYPKRQLNHQAIFAYQGLIVEILYAYKYGKHYACAQLFQEELQEVFAQYKSDNLSVVPIPSSQTTLVKRGFNPVEGLLATANISYTNLLTNHAVGQKQSEKDRKARMETAQPFSCQADLFDKSVLLLDDVYTTGRTLMHAYDVLEVAGASNIHTLSLAR